MAKDLQDSNRRRLFYSLINIETQSLSGSGQSEVFQDHTLIIVSEGLGFVEAEMRQFPLEKGTGFLFEPGLLSKSTPKSGDLAFIGLLLKLSKPGKTGRVK
ncbi:hypothetical protein MHH52_11050 [Paenibacillus sp. FSL K6-0276]|uniref:hypothetical protein n=1 Tax=Paenibacillus sp. FSL K6-0276 TaxID=2921450 RepID=UPI0030EC43FD